MVGGIILAGGRSVRMGRNKALLRLQADGLTIIEQVVAALQTVCASEPIIVTNTPVIYQWLGLSLVGDNFSNAGPLAGIEAGLTASLYDYNVVVGCDMPYLQPALLECLVAYIQQTALAVVPLNQVAKPEPLCALYSKRALPIIRKQLQQKQYKLLGLLNEIEPLYVAASQLQIYDPPLRSFVNLNSPSDLEDLLV